MNQQKKIAELRLDAARAQTNPHFIFNVLNSIGSSVVTGDRMESYGVLTKFSKLIRRMFENHEHPCWSLKDEVRFLTDYLDLQKQRFKDYFDYRIDLQNNISEETLIPRLFLQTLAENALKHGILPSGGKKNIITRIYKEESRTIITMENDGLPRKALDTKLNPSSENGNSRSNGREHEDDSTGKGLSIAQQLFDIFNLYNKEKIHFDIEDLMDDTGHPAGVRVRVSIPDNYNYRVFDTSANQVRN